MDNTQVHEKILYPVTRVRASDSGGSGVMIYSEPDPKNEGQYINIALTCQHVVDKNIKVRDEFDTVLKRDVKRDVMEEVHVELFDYNGSNIASANSMTGGCSLLHDPFPNFGTLTYLREMIEQKAYIMQNAPSIFGNSGGGLFHGETGHLLGLTSRVTVTQLGFGVDVQSWMGFSTHPDRLYEFFDHQELQFLYDDNDDYYSAMKRRADRRRDALRSIMIEGQGIQAESADTAPPEEFVISKDG